MASLLNGPLLQNPSDTGITVWVRADGAGNFRLDHRVTGEVDWITGSTVAADTSLEDTAVLTATGLLPATKYDYRVMLDSVQVATNTTWTMPFEGRFIWYCTSDQHGSNADVAAWILADFEANYEPSGIPAFVSCTGDFYFLGTTATKSAATTLIAGEIDEMAGGGLMGERIPFVFQWDDQDSYGNNSSTTKATAYGSEPDHIAAGLEVYSYFFRGQPQPRSDDTGFSFEVAGMPFVFLDGRTKRSPQDANSPAFNHVYGNKPYDGTETFLGTDQVAWAIEELRQFCNRGAVILATGGTFRSNVTGNSIISDGASGIGATRDSIGIFWKPERNHILRSIASCGYSSQRRLLVLSGDDHWNVVWEGTAGEEMKCNDPTLNHPGRDVGVPFLEFKVRSSSAGGAVGNSPTIFGDGDWFHYSTPAKDAILVWDVTTSGRGTHVEARIRYIDGATGNTMVSQSNKANGNTGDFFYKNGYFGLYDDNRTEQGQKFPPENGRYGVQFKRTFIEDVGGLPSRGVFRDRKERLVDYESDHYDRLDIDDLREQGDWPRRVEIPDEPF